MSLPSPLEKTFEDFVGAFKGQIPTDFAPIDSLINKKTVGFSLPLENKKQNIGDKDLYYDIVRVSRNDTIFVCLQIHYTNTIDEVFLTEKLRELSDIISVEATTDIYYKERMGKNKPKEIKGICIKNNEEFTPNKIGNYATTIEKVKGALGNLSKVGAQITRLMREAEERITKTVEKISISIVPNLHPLNQILYGAPGTGKTYNTINHALAIIENKPIAEYDNMNRADLKKTFDDYVENKQIAFVTFHQSLSYEDFIEGLKPKSEGNNISYAVEDGIFKQMAKNASDDIKAVVTHKYHNFEEAYQKLISRLPLTLKTTSDDMPFKLESRSENSLAVLPSKNENSKERIISKDKIQGYFKGQEEVSSPSYVRAIAQYLVNDCGYIVLPNNYVLIIDEINRGNVAQIFGELITLIEQSKRQEATEAINLTLPYSKEAFGVPQNLYIIGTMNTADRSVEALDTALRRRFDFVEMQPKPEILAGKMSEICLKTVLTNLNTRIAYLLDSDHAIGHAYFMDVDNADKLAQVFEHKIVPLLREYFYNDYEKIQMILGEDFVQSKSDMPKFAGKKNPQKKATYHFLQVQADNIIAALKTAGLDE